MGGNQVKSLRWMMALSGLALALVACQHAPAPLPALDLPLPAPVTSPQELERFLSSTESPPPPRTASPNGDGVGLTEADLRRLALERNPQVVEADLALRQAEAAVRRAGQWPNPDLEGKMVVSMEGNPAGEAALKFPIPLGGRIGAQEDLAGVALELARRDLDAARRTALAQVDRAMARWSLHQARLALFTTLRDRSSQYAELARSRREASVADSVDVALVLADAAKDARRVFRARAELRQARVELLRLCGLPSAEAMPFILPPLARQGLAENQAALQKAALKASDGLARARLRFRLADGQLGLRLAEQWPDLKLGPAFVGDAGGVALGLALGVEIPLLHQRGGQVEEARLHRERAAALLRLEARDVVAGIQARFFELEGLDGELDGLLSEAAAELDQATVLAEVRFTSGQLDVLRLLSVHRSFASLKLEYLALLHAQRLALIDLQARVGRPLRFAPEEGRP